jgi:gliding motility-associated-like protein
MHCKTILLFLFIITGYIRLSAQCSNLDFVASSTTGCAPFSAKFTALNYPPGSEFSWDLGDGIFSTQSPADSLRTSVFTSGGQFNIRLKVFLPGGVICTLVKNSYIRVGTKPTAVFSIDKALLCHGPDTVTFTDLTPNSVSRDWIIDGVFYNNTPKVLKVLVSGPGYKSVSMNMKDSFGCEALANKDSAFLLLEDVKVNFSASDTLGCTPLNVKFTPYFTGLSGQTITAYSWTLTGSSSATSSTDTPQVSYNNAGSYNVRLDITTNTGCTYSLTKTAWINVGSSAFLTFQANSQNICKGQPVRIVNTTPGLPMPGTFTWTIDSSTIVQGNIHSDTIFVKYPVPGSYSVKLDYFYNGCSSTKTISNYINVMPPVASFFSNDRRNCFIPDTVAFTNTSVIPATGTTTYSWTVYDQNKVTVLAVSTLKNPTFIINKFGRFDVRLIVSNTNGCSDTLRETDYIIVDTATAQFTANPLIACVGQTITFQDASPQFSNKAPKKYLWKFYDLDSATILKTDINSSPTMVYNNAGKYNVWYAVYNDFGCGDTLVKHQYITVGYPVADFAVSDTFLCANDHLTILEKTQPKIPTLTHSWVIQHADSPNITITGSDYGVGANIYRLFTVPGTYNVSYWAINQGTACRDSIIKYNYLKVGGIKGSFSASKVSGCLPLTVSFSSIVNYNFHYKNNSGAITYSWMVTPAGDGASSAGYSIANPSSQNTDIIFSGKGRYKVNCKLVNSDGCEYMDSLDEMLISAGADADFSMSPFVCLYDTLTVSNNSGLDPVSFKWFSDTSAHFWPADTSMNPKITFTEKGDHQVHLISFTADGCTDTSTLPVIVSKPVADFYSHDTVSICSPAMVHFTSSSSVDAAIFYWDFGDGSPVLKTTDTTVSHFFKIKNGVSTFDIRLVAVDSFGCSDTMLKKNYIDILGPVPYFKMYNTKGCEPLNVHFVDSSRNVYRFIFSYGVGPVDSVSITDMVYSVVSPTALYSVFKPYLFVFDNSGTCSQYYQPADSIVVYRNPDAFFYATDSSGCAPFTVAFNDTSIGAAHWEWDFNNDGITDDTVQNPVHIYANPGVYSVKLIVKNQYGCPDTMVKPDYITALEVPVADFQVSDTLVCPKTPIYFTNNSTSVNTVIRYLWDFGITGLQSDTSDAEDPAPYIYNNPGSYSISLTLWDKNGCSDTRTRTALIKVKDSVPPTAESIYYVTVVNDNDVLIVWNKNLAQDFVSYNLERDAGTGFSPLVSKTLVSDTIHTDVSGINVKTQAYSYRLDANDDCNHYTAMSSVHATIYLDATTFSQNSNLITWTGYQGWPAGSFNYKLYRSNAYAGSYILYAQQPGSDTDFVDLLLCDSDYYYYVEAVQNITGFVSRSNVDFNHVPFYYPVLPIELIRATVINDKDVLVEWDTTGPANINKKNYYIDRLDPSGNWVTLGNNASGSFTDNNASVHSSSYAYRVRMQDYCDHISPGSNLGKSIWLKPPAVTYEDYTVNLSWTAYLDWFNNVDHYEVEFYDLQTGLFKLLAVLPNTDSTFLDNTYHKTDSAWCYRIKAVEALQPLPDTSISNISCVMMPPKLFVPNAFSPNNDGVNDIFQPQGSFIQNLTGKPLTEFNLRIYDRWGELLFETNDFSKGWDGTVKTVPAEPGIYLYQIRATGYNHERFNYKGTFHLLR